FLLTGGHIVGFIDAAVQEGMRLIDVRHEEAAAHAADAYARLTGKPGVAFVTAGPGATNAVTGVAAAWHAGSPLVLVVGRHPEFQDQRGALQEMDHRPIFQGISKWTATGRDPERFGELAVTALRHATAGRGGPVVIEVDALAQL
ncbi:MAG: acetolactate synthase, partial [Actinobacteria bacterium]|nr:acetolactate synthase [Actinomycetota bacterium]NIS34885.1 acetolactate synthase [Actinomycetota bacterium]NIU69632.1 acetolactate synthase [Actinomycetota bacterium]NIV57999.1 acetolactate synthase [Actinomycetota bacterium]NIW31498.1 acetolactate synthase [Actinomycetota bacterium]